MQTVTFPRKVVSVLLSLVLIISLAPTLAFADYVDAGDNSLITTESQGRDEAGTDNDSANNLDSQSVDASVIGDADRNDNTNTAQSEFRSSENNSGAISENSSPAQNVNLNDSQANENEVNDQANSWRYANGEQIYSYEGTSTEALDPYAITPFAAAPNASSYATWYKSNGISSYTYKADPDDDGKNISVDGVKRVGIDVSYHNGTINWKKVKDSGVSFAIIRCGYGSDFKNQDDTEFLDNVQGAQENGIDIGIYLYSYAMNTTGSDSSASSEAKHVLRLLDEAGLEPSDLAYPIFYDLEESKQLNLGAKKLGNLATTFCDAISSEGYKVGIYSNLNWWTNYLTDSAFDNSNWHKWVARYPGSNKATSSGVDDTEIWQFSDCGHVDGVNGNVDMNFDYVSSYKYSGWVQEGDKWYYLNTDGSHKTGWLKTGGEWYYLDPEKDGVMLTGVYEVDGKYYSSDSSGAMYSSGWAKVSGKWYYASSDGSLKTGWQKISDKWYYLDPSTGAMATGWKQVGKTWYYLNSSGAMLTGWQKVSGKWYYLNSSGAMATGWKKVSGKWYYMNSSGVMQTGWEKVDNTWYYLDSSGAMKTGWLKTGGKWYYLNSSGAMKTGWVKLSGKWYYLNSSGAMQTGWEQVGKTWYYMNSSGVMQTGWLKAGGKWYYLNSSGAMATGWKKVSGKWYYLNSSGAMQTGWEKVDNTWYYLDSSGVMETGWLKTGGKWYYLNSSGAMAAGWVKLSGKWYYLNSSGAMVTGTKTIDGVKYKFNSSGVWVS